MAKRQEPARKLTDEEQKIIDRVEKRVEEDEGRKLTEQEINFFLEQAQKQRKQLRNADPWEYQNKLDRAAAELPTAKPATEGDRLALAEFIKKVQKLAPPGRHGRAHVPSETKITPEVRARLASEKIVAAERCTAKLVLLRKKVWCQQEGRQRMRPSEVAQFLIPDAIKTIEFQWSIPAGQIRPDAVKVLLKNMKNKNS
jgi:hypothetical protein